MDCPKRNSLAGLPDEAMLEILARVPFRSVCRSKCVAKAWRDLIDDPLNRRRLPQTLQGFFSMFPPMCFRYDSDLEQFFKYLALASSVPLDIDPCLSFSFLMKLPETESVSFLDSCNGLLLFEHCPRSNPYDVLS
jgi:hypothetical protein